jgi:hypothetical protein
MRAPTANLCWLGLVLGLSVGAGCTRDLVGAEPPVAQPHFPVGLAIHPTERLLAVVSSNFDLEYSSGSLLLADLDVVDEQLASGAVVAADQAYVSSAQVPSFGSRPLFVLEGRHILLPTRSENLIVEVGLTGADGDSPALECGDSLSPLGEPLCDTAPRALQLPGNDPFALVSYGGGDEHADVVAAALGAPWLYFFRFRAESDDNRRLQQNGLRTLADLAPDGEIRGVRGLAYRPPGGGVGTGRVFATVERTAATLRGEAVDLVFLDPARRGDAPLGVIHLTEETGAVSARDVALSPAKDAVFVLLREPDGIARIDLFASNFFPHVGGVVTTCEAPTSMATARLTTASGETVDRLLVTCFDNESVIAYDPLTLSETGAARYFGRGPFDIVVDEVSDPPRAYVSFFSDDTIGVLDLLDDEGAPRLVPRGRIGEQRAAPEDGR